MPKNSVRDFSLCLLYILTVWNTWIIYEAKLIREIIPIKVTAPGRAAVLDSNILLSLRLSISCIFQLELLSLCARDDASFFSENVLLRGSRSLFALHLPSVFICFFTTSQLAGVSSFPYWGSGKQICILIFHGDAPLNTVDLATFSVWANLAVLFCCFGFD